MNIKLIFGLSVIAVGTLGFLLGSKFAASKLKKKQEEMETKYANDLNKLKKDFDELHRVFVESQPPEIAGERQKTWDKISEDLKKTPEERAAESEPLDAEVEHPDDLNMNFKRDDEERQNYNKYVEATVKYDAAHPTKDIIRSEAANGIVEIEEWEYRETKYDLPSEDLQYHELSTDLYFDENEEMIDPADIPLYVGYNQEELAVRFLHDDEPDRIIIRNPEHGKFYIVYLHEGAV